MIENKDFIIPCDFASRKPYLLDQLLFVPPNYNEHEKAKIALMTKDQIFEKKSPIHIEYCSGNGTWILDLASKNQSVNFIAVEMQFERARRIWVKMKNAHLSNLFVVYGEALTFTKYYLKEALFEKIYINFPDPWPKNKHAKHRLVTKEFLLEVASKSYKEANLMIVTDDKEAAFRMSKEAIFTNIWKPLLKHPFYTHDYKEYGRSYFKALWESKGKKIFYYPFINKDL